MKFWWDIEFKYKNLITEKYLLEFIRLYKCYSNYAHLAGTHLYFLIHKRLKVRKWLHDNDGNRHAEVIRKSSNILIQQKNYSYK